LKEKKRKQFDSVKQRAENLDKVNNYPTEIAIVANPTTAVKESNSSTKNAAKKKTNTKKHINAGASDVAVKQSSTAESSKKSNWRAKHEEFLRAIRAARGEEVPQTETEPVNQEGGARSKSLPPGMVECPTCSRRFSERAADRHVQWCAEQRQKQQMKGKQSNTSNQEAMERMKARTKVRETTEQFRQLHLMSTFTLNLKV